ncbi:hypothetical protein NE237_006381 [Protea cynaroides]|uniref:Uncharacterized protein n=1 Tax=Protea cynaroides TaxID=273540 RepID=A0A9Q0KM91_9MAGN|nr:hypothetical protein NE237_006381 [Protea cynaroides]
MCSSHLIQTRRQYLSNAVLQAKNASNSDDLACSPRGAFDNGLLDFLEGKLAVLLFQIKIKEELEAIASGVEASSGTNESAPDDSAPREICSLAPILQAQHRKRSKSYSEFEKYHQLYNDRAVPFELWEVNLFFCCVCLIYIVEAKH